jgi:hypothetical protein
MSSRAPALAGCAATGPLSGDPCWGFFAARAGIDQKIAALSARSAGAVPKLNARPGYNYSGHLVGVVNRSMTKSPAIVNTAISVGTKARS